MGLEQGESFFDEGLSATGHRLKLPGGDILFYEPEGEGIVSDTLKKEVRNLLSLPFREEIGRSKLK